MPAISPQSKAKESERKKRYYQARKAGAPEVAPLQNVKTVMVYGFTTKDGKWGKTWKVGDTQYRSSVYEMWRRMRARCRPGSSYQKASPNYIGCTVHDDFEDFQKFSDWYAIQIGAGQPDYDLDKDILGNGVKVYGPETCVLVPHGLNTFFTEKPDKGLSCGVQFDKARGKYRAEMRSDGGPSRFLGRFDTAEEAERAYSEAKQAEARRWIERIEAGEYIVDPRVIDALRKRSENVEGK